MPVWTATGLTLECDPPLPEHVTLPWDSADEYLLRAADQNALLINDRFGALACAFPAATLWSDSASARHCWQQNLQRNGLPDAEPRCVSDLTAAARNKPLILIRLPKTLDQLIYWLNQITVAAPDARILLAGMAKHIPVSWLKTLESRSAEYHQYPIQRKARLIRIRHWQSDNQPPWKGYISDDGLILKGLPGVFCRDHEDIGSRVLLRNLQLPGQGVLIDLGCGNGLLALTAARRQPGLSIIATDDSRAAVLSAQENARANGLTLDVRQGDSLSAVPEQADIILCNPPFHDGHRQLTDIALRMFREAAGHLRADGRLLVIANRHLPYFKPLRRLFRQVHIRSEDPKFSLYECQNPHHSTD